MEFFLNYTKIMSLDISFLPTLPFFFHHFTICIFYELNFAHLLGD